MPETPKRCFKTNGHQTVGDANKFKRTMYSGVPNRIQGKAEQSKSKFKEWQQLEITLSEFKATTRIRQIHGEIPAE